MTYNVTIKYPKLDETKDKGSRETQIKEILDLNLNDTGDLYRKLELEGYKINPSIKINDQTTIDAVEIAQNLVRTGLDYTVDVKLKASGMYDIIQPIAAIIEQHGYDSSIAVKMEVNDESTVNFDKPDTWAASQDATFSVNPKIKKIKNIAEVYDMIKELQEITDPQVIIKPKKAKSLEEFLNQLNAFGEYADVTLTLKDAY